MKIAIYQGPGIALDVAANIQTIGMQAERAARARARLLIAPEMILSGYNIGPAAIAERAENSLHVRTRDLFDQLFISDACAEFFEISREFANDFVEGNRESRAGDQVADIFYIGIDQGCAGITQLLQRVFDEMVDLCGGDLREQRAVQERRCDDEG